MLLLSALHALQDMYRSVMHRKADSECSADEGLMDTVLSLQLATPKNNLMELSACCAVATLQLEAALARKEKGTVAYKAGKLSRAARQYSQAVEIASSVSEKDHAPNPVDESAGMVQARVRSGVKVTAHIWNNSQLVCAEESAWS